MSIRPLHPDLAAVAEKELGETPEKMANGLKLIKEWIAQQPHLKATTDDQFLASYLRGLKFNLDKVKEKLELFYTCRSIVPEFYQLNHTHELFYEILRTGFYVTLPNLSAPGARRICLTRMGVLDFTKYSILDVLNVAHLMDRIMIVDDDNSVVAGNINILDLQGVNLTQLLDLPPNALKKLMACMQDALPFENTYTYLRNAPPLFNMIMNEIKMLFQFSRSNQLQTDLESLSPETRNILPVEYGGNGGTVEDAVEYWIAKIREYREWLDNDLQCGTDESQRIDGPKTTEDMFGSDRFATVGLANLFNTCD